MWSQGWRNTDASGSHPAGLPKSLAVLPATVSQLLSASRIDHDSLCNRVSVVGVVRGCAPFVTNLQYSVDDMTGPPLTVKQWVDKDPAMRGFYCPGTYVKVIGSLREFSGQRTLLATDVRPIRDLNEITSHMMEVVQGQMQLFGKGLDVNMNRTAAAFLPGRWRGGPPQHGLSKGLSNVQQQVLEVIRSHSMHHFDISLDFLKMKLSHLSMEKIRSSLTFLQNEGHIFCTNDDQHFRSTPC